MASTNYDASMVKSETGTTIEAAAAGGAARTYYGKCQYKTGKCFNERTLKRNGDAHSLCEEHRIKQNLIQRRSDRKYQTIHAIRRRERSQRRAVLKKQVSMAVAQQLFYEHQHQKTIGMHALNGMPAPETQSVAAMAPPIQIPNSVGGSRMSNHFSMSFLTNPDVMAAPVLSFSLPPTAYPTIGSKDAHAKMDLQENEDDDDECDEGDEDMGEDGVANEAQPTEKDDETTTPTGIDDFTPESFLSVCVPEGEESFMTLAPLISSMSEKEMWSDEDITFLHNLLLH